ncbi:Fc.00g108040.m01.CDS01 [Cosmosporella sp. VM-42]
MLIDYLTVRNLLFRCNTVAQLSEALGEDTDGMLDLQRSIVDFCGGFIVIDKSGNVAMIHQTAREYLLTSNVRGLGIDRPAAHDMIFSSCMQCLMDVGVRAKIARNEMAVFLDYAATSWPSHLASSFFSSLAGKLGTNLRRNSSSVYKLIAPFCPHKSSIYQIFGKMEAKSLIVSGLSSETWDDFIARISHGHGAFASSISVAGAHIFVLTSSGNVFIYESSTFEESITSPITHGERVYLLEVNSAGTLFATYGYRTTKIWETSTGECRLLITNIESRPRPLVMLFADNSTMLLVELEEQELEEFILNASSYMILSKDGNWIAVSYRGHPFSAWGTEGPAQIGHCWRKRVSTDWGEVIDAAWLPHSPEVLGVYTEGVVFKWNPYGYESAEIAAGAKRLALSNVVFGIAFSLSSHRFYDIRGYYANVWEPNALMSFAEQKDGGIDHGSETHGVSHVASPIFCPSVDSITVLASIPNGGYIFTALNKQQ